MTCAHAVRVAILKFDGVIDADISLQRGHAKVTLKPGNTVELNKVISAVGHQALEVRQVSIVANGSAVSDAKQGWGFVVLDTGERIALKGTPPTGYQEKGPWTVSFSIPKKSKIGNPAVMSKP